MIFNHRLITQSKPLLLIIVAALMIYLAVRLFMSSLYSIQTNLFLDDWQVKQTVPTEQVTTIAKQAIAAAEKWSPIDNAFLHGSKGKVYEWNTYAEAYGDKSVYPDRLMALNAYRQQAKLTPHWPNAWLNILTIKVQLNEFDAEFAFALNQAQQVANGHINSLLQLSAVAMQAWHGLANAQKNQMLKVISRSASQSSQNSAKLRVLLEGSKLLSMTCIYSKAIKLERYKLCD